MRKARLAAIGLVTVAALAAYGVTQATLAQEETATASVTTQKVLLRECDGVEHFSDKDHTLTVTKQDIIYVLGVVVGGTFRPLQRPTLLKHGSAEQWADDTPATWALSLPGLGSNALVVRIDERPIFSYRCNVGGGVHLVIMRTKW